MDPARRSSWLPFTLLGWLLVGVAFLVGSRPGGRTAPVALGLLGAMFVVVGVMIRAKQRQAQAPAPRPAAAVSPLHDPERLRAAGALSGRQHAERRAATAYADGFLARREAAAHDQAGPGDLDAQVLRGQRAAAAALEDARGWAAEEAVRFTTSMEDFGRRFGPKPPSEAQ